MMRADQGTIAKQVKTLTTQLCSRCC